ncbi:MAG TPA: type II secretion system F family protein [Pseudonocardia sp.]|nr:type II secretion system F family protein [Pseudonocardia sp.]
MISLLMLAAALLVAPWAGPAVARLRQLALAGEPDMAVTSSWALPAVCALASAVLVLALIGGTTGWVLAAPVGALGWRSARRLLAVTSRHLPDPLELAGGWDLLAACLRSGLPVPVAVRAIADHMPAQSGTVLRTIADRLALGADSDTAWDTPESSPVHKLAVAARRSAHSGAGLADVATHVAAEVRAHAVDQAAARGQRAGVLITGPLGLCFLPAFVALGVVPVVVSLASELAITW